MGLGFRQINTCRKVPLDVNCLDDNILHCLLWVLSFYGPTCSMRTALHAQPMKASTLRTLYLSLLSIAHIGGRYWPDQIDDIIFLWPPASLPITPLYITHMLSSWIFIHRSYDGEKTWSSINNSIFSGKNSRSFRALGDIRVCTWMLPLLFVCVYLFNI